MDTPFNSRRQAIIYHPIPKQISRQQKQHSTQAITLVNIAPEHAKDMQRKTIFITPYQSPCGRLLLGAYGDRFCLCDWQAVPHHTRVLRRLQCLLHAEIVQGTSPVTEQAAIQLDEYFAGTRRALSVPLLFAGSAFQQSVWNELLHIPYSTTISYADLSQHIGKPTAVRAVANATGANALSIFVPCHRVIGTNGSLTGYAGGLSTKQWLLHHEATQSHHHTPNNP